MLVNEYKLYVSIQKSSKDAKFGQCLYLGVPLCYEQNWCAEPQLIEYMVWRLDESTYNSLTMLVSVYARIWVYLVTCVLYFFPHNQ